MLLFALVPAPLAWAQSYQQLHDWCYGGGNTEQTIQGCTSVINAKTETQADVAIAYFNRGLMQRRLGHNDPALQNYNQSIRLKPDYSIAYNSRCYLFAITNRLQDALKDCNEALRLDPKNQYAYDSRAFAYLKLGMLDASIADYNSALALEPNRP